jgi:hypothetical protein
MTSRDYGLTPEKGLARLREAERIADEAERWTAYLQILRAVHFRGYEDGLDDA